MEKSKDSHSAAVMRKAQFLFNAAVQFSTEFWTTLYAISCDLGLLHSVHSTLEKKHKAGEDEEALNLLYVMNLFYDAEMELPITEITKSKADISAFMELFLWVAEDDIDDVEDDPAEL